MPGCCRVGTLSYAAILFWLCHRDGSDAAVHEAFYAEVCALVFFFVFLVPVWC